MQRRPGAAESLDPGLPLWEGATVRSQAEKDELTLDIATTVLPVAAWLALVLVAALVGAALDEVLPPRVLPAIAFLGFWPAVLLGRRSARRRRTPDGD